MQRAKRSVFFVHLYKLVKTLAPSIKIENNVTVPTGKLLWNVYKFVKKQKLKLYETMTMFHEKQGKVIEFLTMYQKT